MKAGHRRGSTALGAAVACAALALFHGSARAGELARPLPDTSYGIHVFDDQLAPGLSDAQLAFWTARVAGTQKMTRVEADRLRAHDPGFLILHYRLGMGLGYRFMTAPCTPLGGWLQIIDGSWVQEWPGDANVQERWFEKGSGQRRLQCQHGWYLMDLDDASWRAWWTDTVMAQLAHNEADGVFADSLMVPNYLGGFEPPLAAYDPVFENAWAERIEDFVRYAKQRFDGRWLVIPNVGWWVTTRDPTDFSVADGVFIEGFGRDVWASFGEEGWRIQAERLLGLAARGKVVIGESWHTWGTTERTMTIASYLLVKGEHGFVDLEDGEGPTWYPEYEIPIGEPLESALTVDELRDPQSGLYRRAFTNGVAYANPSAQTRSVQLGTTLLRAVGVGGGYVGSNGLPPAGTRLDWVPTSTLTLQPGEGAVLVADTSPYELALSPLVAGQACTLTIEGAEPGTLQVVYATRNGPGVTRVPELGLFLGLTDPRAVLALTADASGRAQGSFALPAGLVGSDLSFQVAQRGSVTQVVTERVFAP